MERERKSRKEGGPVILKFRVVFHFYATDNMLVADFDLPYKEITMESS